MGTSRCSTLATPQQDAAIARYAATSQQHATPCHAQPSPACQTDGRRLVLGLIVARAGRGAGGACAGALWRCRGACMRCAARNGGARGCAAPPRLKGKEGVECCAAWLAPTVAWVLGRIWAPRHCSGCVHAQGLRARAIRGGLGRGELQGVRACTDRAALRSQTCVARRRKCVHVRATAARQSRPPLAALLQQWAAAVGQARAE